MSRNSTFTEIIMVIVLAYIFLPFLMTPVEWHILGHTLYLPSFGFFVALLFFSSLIFFLVKIELSRWK